MLLIFVLEAAALALLYIYTKRIPVDFGEGSHKSNPIKLLFMPISYFIADKLMAGRFITYERKLNSKLALLHGVRDIKQRVRDYYAVKAAYMVGAVLGVTLLGVMMDKLDISYAVFAVAVLIIVFYAPDKELEGKIKRRNFLLQYDFPDFLNKLVLLVNAGMTVPRAWEKIVTDRKNWTPLYEELNTTFLEIRNGKPEHAAYEDFARRCRVKEITKFVTTILQNLRKGNSELVTLLKLQSNECWQLRKNMARKLGEEASTKLVLPLMIMFVGILVIVILPAILQLRYL